MCKSCQVLIGCSCYCKNEWKSSIRSSGESNGQKFCTKCNHSLLDSA